MSPADDLPPRAPWVLLPIDQLPNADTRHELLGAVVLDYRRPTSAKRPHDIAAFIEGYRDKVEETEDGNFETLIQYGISKEAHARLGEIATAEYRKKAANFRTFRTIGVTTYWLKDEDIIFNALKEKYLSQIVELMAHSRLLDRGKVTQPGTVYMVVGLKTCWDAEVKSTAEDATATVAEASVPVTAAAAASGNPAPVNVDVGAGFRKENQGNVEASMVLKHERVFAVQYQLVQDKRSWIRASLLKQRLPGVSQRGLLAVSHSEGFSGEDEAEQLASDEPQLRPKDLTSTLSEYKGTALTVNM